MRKFSQLLGFLGHPDSIHDPGTEDSVEVVSGYDWEMLHPSARELELNLIKAKSQEQQKLILKHYYYELDLILRSESSLDHLFKDKPTLEVLLEKVPKKSKRIFTYMFYQRLFIEDFTFRYLDSACQKYQIDVESLGISRSKTNLNQDAFFVGIFKDLTSQKKFEFMLENMGTENRSVSCIFRKMTESLEPDIICGHNVFLAHLASELNVNHTKLKMLHEISNKNIFKFEALEKQFLANK